MRRRELLVLMGAAVAVARPLRAQQKAVPVIGYLNPTSPDAAAPATAAFLRGLSQPITGLSFCCARSARGAVTVPPSNSINLRLFTL